MLPSDDAHLVPRETSRYMTKFEFSKAVGTVAMHIAASRGGELYEESPFHLACRQVLEKRVPLVIRRYLPSGGHEDCALAHLLIDSSIRQLLATPSPREEASP